MDKSTDRKPWWKMSAAELGVSLLIVVVLVGLLLPPSMSGSHPRRVEGDRVLAAIAESIEYPVQFEWLWLARPIMQQRVTESSDILAADIALAGIITCDGHVEPAWELARHEGAALVAFAQAMQHLPDAAMRLELYHYLLPLAASDSPTSDVTCDVDMWNKVRSEALRAMAQAPARDDEVRSLLAQVADDEKLAAAVEEALLLLDEKRDLYVRRHVREYLSGDAQEVLSADSRPMFAAGRRLFHELSCHKCHPIDGPSSPLGPSLAHPEFPTKLSEVFTGIVAPDAKVDAAYREQMAIADGKVITGLVVAESDEEIVLSTDPLRDCEPVKILRDDLEEPIRALNTSPMASGMVDSLTADELLHLVHYVAARGQLDE